MPLSAPDARTRINERVTVEMPVKAAKNCQRCSLMFLDSEEDHHDANNFAVAVTELKLGQSAAYVKTKIKRLPREDVS